MPDTPQQIGASIAEEVFTRRLAARASRATALNAHPNPLSMRVAMAAGGAADFAAASVTRTAGFLVAAGDSWFDYPIHDVLTVLDDDYGYTVESAAHRGDPIESMAYRNGQLDKVARCIDKVKAQGAVPRAVLLSGGGDDIAGNEFGMLLNNATSPIAGWNDAIVDGVLKVRIAEAYRTMLTGIMTYCRKDLGRVVPIVVHGYDYPVPDGRGFLGGWPFPGPWLKPGFDEKLFSDLPKSTELMHGIIDRFNAMVAAVVAESDYAGNVHYVDLRGTLTSDLAGDAYKQSWANELHPTGNGFAAVAKKIADVLAVLP